MEGILCCHVDDFVWGGTKNFKNKVIKLLNETFSISLERCETFKYLGLDVCENDNVITLHQILILVNCQSVMLRNQGRFVEWFTFR